MSNPGDPWNLLNAFDGSGKIPPWQQAPAPQPAPVDYTPLPFQLVAALQPLLQSSTMFLPQGAAAQPVNFAPLGSVQSAAANPWQGGAPVTAINNNTATPGATAIPSPPAPISSGTVAGQSGAVPQSLPPGPMLTPQQTAIVSNNAMPGATNVGAIAPFQGYPAPPPSSDALLVQQATLRALGLVNPGQNETGNVVPYTDDFAKVADPAAINTKDWQHTWSLHAINPVESPIPGYPGYVVKAYDDPSLGNTVAVTYPTWSARHIIDAIPDYFFDDPMNPGIAQGFLNATGGNKNGRK